MPQQTHAQIIDQIASINRTIRGINISYDSRDLPPRLTQFPACMVLLGQEDYGKFGACEYWVRCYVADARTGNSATAYRDCLTLSTEFHDTYKALSFIGDRYIDREAMSTKMGFGSSGFLYTLKWGDGEFFGLSVNLPLLSSIAGN